MSSISGIQYHILSLPGSLSAEPGHDTHTPKIKNWSKRNLFIFSYSNSIMNEFSITSFIIDNLFFSRQEMSVFCFLHFFLRAFSWSSQCTNARFFDLCISWRRIYIRKNVKICYRMKICYFEKIVFSLKHVILSFSTHMFLNMFQYKLWQKKFLSQVFEHHY